jgi:hypothetical protein
VGNVSSPRAVVGLDAYRPALGRKAFIFLRDEVAHACGAVPRKSKALDLKTKQAKFNGGDLGHCRLRPHVFDRRFVESRRSNHNYWAYPRTGSACNLQGKRHEETFAYFIPCDIFEIKVLDQMHPFFHKHRAVRRHGWIIEGKRFRSGRICAQNGHSAFVKP